MTLHKINSWLGRFGLILIVEHDGENFGNGYFHFQDEGDTHLRLMTIGRFRRCFQARAIKLAG